jgi:hypothetical protein
MLSKNSTLCSKSRFLVLLLLLLSFTSFNNLYSQTLYPNPDSIPFAPAVNYATGDGPSSVFCADLDGDSDPDLAVVNDFSNNVSILKNNGDGTFQNKVDYGVGDYPVSVFCADLDGDGDLDLAVANRNSDNVSILKNNGDGTFAGAVNYEAGGGSHSVFCADLDGDSDMDLAVVNVWDNDVSIFKNNGDGTFQNRVDYGVGDYPLSVFCADLDGDFDLAVANAGEYGNSVSILKNNGDGTFQTKVDYVVGAYPRTIFCADLDGDGDLDLSVGNAESDNISILKNNGDGTFKAKVDYAAGDYPHSIFCADLDGDIDLDLAVANRLSDNVSILKNNGNGTFQTKVDYIAGDGASSIFCADIDGDGDLDLLVANQYSNNVSVLKNLTLTNPLVGYWKFEEGTGTTAYDSSGKNNHGTIYGTTWTDGKLGKGLNFTKLSDYVEVNDSPSLDLTDHLTITAWIKPHAYPDYWPKIAGKGDGNTSSYWLGFTGGSVILTLGNGAGYCEAYHPFVLDEWAYVAATWDGTTMHIYINGKDEEDTNYTGTLTPNEHPLIIGSRDNGYNDYFNGTIDEVKIYNRALSGDEIREEYERVTLAAYWKFDEGTGNIAYDSSAFGNDGTLMNEPTWVDGLPLLGKALEFNGVDDYVDISKNAIVRLTNGTILAWIYPDELTSDNWFFAYAMDSYRGVALCADLSGRICGQLNQGVGQVMHGTTLGLVKVGQWNHLVMTWDGVNVKMYVNGEIDATIANSGYPQDNNSSLIIGADSFIRDYWSFRGKIDAPKIYNRALSTEEIKDEFESGFARGDANADGKLTVSDVVYLINYLFKGGTFPQPLQSGDCNCDDKITVSDVVYLINYLFKGGPPPC